MNGNFFESDQASASYVLTGATETNVLLHSILNSPVCDKCAGFDAEQLPWEEGEEAGCGEVSLVARLIN